MKTNHLKTANKYIEKQISKLRLEQARLGDKAAELIGRSNVIEAQIQGLYKSQQSLMGEPEVEFKETQLNF